ncbi:aminomethyl-transferring glycine dehydrogenase subunit GcvPB [Vallitalea okinawensis]|uniref:aminomethyl-transferring glycine dehydrogenase subunit GcvPB n=1 Tax=Vallitalea okinawensis TaxID=2078660 RepID=UPI000CFC4CE0|nr:aminomethyl-transferring glycine dehydrogenase subunit GcvPB [Vallitalea okinawensis]
MKYEKVIFELSKKGRKAFTLPEDEFPEVNINEYIPEHLGRHELDLPEVYEVDVIRHYTNLSNKNFGVDTGFYPLGSCTMKYNPKINEETSSLPGFAHVHPLQEEETVQGSLQLMYELQESLKEITGMAEVTLQPAAGSQGELTGLMIMKAYHRQQGDEKRKNIIVPDSAHGTNPASATMAGFKAVQIPSNPKGTVDIEKLKEVLNDETAGLMLTNPNTLGIFEKDIVTIAKMVHDVGGLLYYDGANMNANMGITRPGDMGFDIVHLNLHKTFSTPHGGGGPGSGPVGVVDRLVKYLPQPMVQKVADRYTLDHESPDSIGSLKSFYGNFGVLVRAYTYIKMMGAEGLKKASQLAVLNANYLKENLKDTYVLPIEGVCKHEFVLAGLGDNEHHVITMDVAKRLIDHGFHPPTIYFPLIIEQALMIEPTETESIENLNAFIDVMKNIAKEAKEDPDALHAAPITTPVGRLDEVKAARNPVLKYKDSIR